MKLVIATPVRAANLVAADVKLGWVSYVKRLEKDLGAHQLGDMAFGADVVKGRNNIAEIALADEQMTHVLWLDDDQYAEDTGIVADMLRTGEDLIGASYVMKTEIPKWAHNPLPGAVMTGNVVEVMTLGFGFTITSRRCLERVRDVSKRYYGDTRSRTVQHNMFGHIYYQPDGEELPVLFGEDYSFCARFRLECGGKAMLYCTEKVHHAGVRSFSGRDMIRAVAEANARDIVKGM